jgi:predicted DNA-binding protein (MmcQ/YjbR family)
MSGGGSDDRVLPVSLIRCDNGGMVAVSMRGAKKLQDELESFALSLPEAWFDTPWDEDRVTKVRKQIFAFYGNQDAPSIGVKLVDSLDEAMSLPGAAAMSYDMGDDGWTSIPIPGLDDSTVDTLHGYIEESFRAIAPKALIEQLDEELAD